MFLGVDASYFLSVLYFPTDEQLEITNISFILQIKEKKKKVDSREQNIPIKLWITELNRELSTEESQMTEKHLKKCSTFLVIREMQIRVTLGFYLTPVKMAKVKNLSDSRCL